MPLKSEPHGARLRAEGVSGGSPTEDRFSFYYCMTVTELIEHLQGFLDERGGEDVEVRLDVDFNKHYPIIDLVFVEDLHGLDGSDAIVLQSLECLQAMKNYEPKFMRQNPALN